MPVSVRLYATPTVAPGMFVVVITTSDAVAATTIESCCVSLPPPLVVCTVKVQVPAAVGVPARLQVILPDAAAQVQIDGRATQSTGTTRYYESPALTPGASYSYRVTATFQRDGQPVTEERVVPVGAGTTRVVDFTRPATP